MREIYFRKYQCSNKEQYLIPEDVESMTGEIENGDLAVRDVADLLQAQYAIIAGKYIHHYKIHLVISISNKMNIFKRFLSCIYKKTFPP